MPGDQSTFPDTIITWWKSPEFPTIRLSGESHYPLSMEQRPITVNLNQLDRRRFLRGSGAALALPLFSSSLPLWATERARHEKPKRLACIYFPDGVPMPLREDPAYQDWSWFPHGAGTEFSFTKCTEVFEPMREELTILSGFSHPEARKIHGHRNADQFLTAAKILRSGPYKNSVSLDQVYAEHIGDQTRFSSLVMSTDGGIGAPRALRRSLLIAPGEQFLPSKVPSESSTCCSSRAMPMLLAG